MEVYGSDWISKTHNDAEQLKNRATRQVRCKRCYAEQRRASLKQLANKQHSAALGGGSGGASSKHPSNSSNLMILPNDILMRIMKTYEITQDSIAFVKNLKAINKRLRTIIRNEMYLDRKYAHQLETIPFLIPGTSIACNAENVESNPVIKGTQDLIKYFKRTGKMGVHQITVSDAYMLGFNAVRCMVDARENVFFLCVRINMQNDIFLEDLQLATPTEYDISQIPNVMRGCLGFHKRTHDSAFIDLVEEETVYYYRTVRCWPDTSMREIYDAIAHVEGWKAGKFKVCLNSKGLCRAEDTIGKVRQECLGNMSVSLFLNWSDPSDSSSDEEAGDCHNQVYDSSSDSEASANDSEASASDSDASASDNDASANDSDASASDSDASANDSDAAS